MTIVVYGGRFFREGKDFCPELVDFVLKQNQQTIVVAKPCYLEELHHNAKGVFVCSEEGFNLPQAKPGDVFLTVDIHALKEAIEKDYAVIYKGRTLKSRITNEIEREEDRRLLFRAFALTKQVQAGKIITATSLGDLFELFKGSEKRSLIEAEQDSCKERRNRSNKAPVALNMPTFA